MIDYENKTTNKEEYGNRNTYDDIIDDIVDKMLYDALEDIEKGMREGYVKDRSDIDTEGMFDYALEVHENYINTALKDIFCRKLDECLSEEKTPHAPIEDAVQMVDAIKELGPDTGDRLCFTAKDVRYEIWREMNEADNVPYIVVQTKSSCVDTSMTLVVDECKALNSRILELRSTERHLGSILLDDLKVLQSSIINGRYLDGEVAKE